ncbi:hypothetical protein Tco_1184323 [Tanacetum coccineum]
MSSGFISNMLNPSPVTGIDSIFNLNTKSTSLVDVPVTAIDKPPLLSVTTTPPPPTPLITHLQQTPVPTPQLPSLFLGCTISITWWKRHLVISQYASFESPRRSGGSIISFKTVKRFLLNQSNFLPKPEGEAKTASTSTSPTTQAQVTYVLLNCFIITVFIKRLRVLGHETVEAFNDAWTEKDQIENFLKERRLMRSFEKFVEHAEFDESDTYVLERFNTSAGNPVKEILLKLNLPDHRILKDRGEVKEFQRSFRHSDTERLSRSDEVLKLKNLKKDATLKLFKSTNQERSHSRQDKEQAQDLKSLITTSNHKLIIEVKDYKLKTKVKA